MKNGLYSVIKFSLQFWRLLRDVKKDQRPYQPHLTVANRDIPAGVSVEELEIMNELNLVEDFYVNSITIFERKGGKWEAACSGDL